MHGLVLACMASSQQWRLSLSVHPSPLLGATPPLANSLYAQVFNPTWVEPSPSNGNRSGLLVRSQNCSEARVGGRCVHCAGAGQRASFLTFAEFEEVEQDRTAPPRLKKLRITAADAVFGPFDCGSDQGCADANGTEDPRLTYDAESGRYFLLYNGWNATTSPFLALASTLDPASRLGWQRHGVLRHNAKSGAILLRPAPSPHYLIWGCATSLTITPSVGRSLTSWDFKRSSSLLSVRRRPYWDSRFVESAMPPLTLSDGNLLFFYNSLGKWYQTSQTGFQPGWAILSGVDPTKVLARSETPPLPYTLPWEAGIPPYTCNVALVTNLGGAHAIGKDQFRLYFGGADTVVGWADVNVTLGEPPSDLRPLA